jgi:chromate reductase
MTTSRDETLHVLAVIGSLRRGSFNRMTCDAAVELAPPEMTFEEADLGSLPFYDDDLRVAQGYPPPAQRLRDAIAAADGVLIVSPEYNHSVPPVLKNAIDWASRPPDQPFKDKPVAIMGASTGRFGTVRMQGHLRQSLISLEALPLVKPEVMIGFAGAAFDDQGRLVDEKAREVIAAQLQAFADLMRRTRGR